MGSPTGRLVALILLAVVEQKELVEKGKRPLGLSPRELHQLLNEITNGLCHVRDALISELEPVTHAAS